MKTELIIAIFFLLILSCKNSSHSDGSVCHNSNIVIANEFIEAFYSFNRDTLELFLTQAVESRPGILYYQKWAECGNYEIIKRHDCIEKNDTLVICPVTVKDDLISALNIDFNVTDTFHLTIIKGQIRAVQTSSNDPDLYYEAKEWVRLNRSELIEEPCEGVWEGGPTPCECVRAMVKGFKEFIDKEKPEEI
ncbi:MAG: hypothetical protein JXK95_16395 [Bacteroidales bacterium]|nr:hypothetical protein [Bacteroidales bacterium]